MFETNSEILCQFGIFAAIGFFLGFGYDILRFFKILLKKGITAVNVEDMLYIPFCAFIIFFCIVEYGGGKLRLYYFIGALFGAALYLVTFGAITKYTAKAARAFFCFIFRCIKAPLYRCYHFFQQIFDKFFSIICQKIKDSVKNALLYLKKGAKMLYNNNNSKMGKLYKKGGEERHVIKAEIRKKA